MTKNELIQEISDQTGIEQSAILAVVHSFMKTVSKEIVEDRSVTLRGFGTFTTKQRAEKTARNISEGTPLIIPAHKIPYFKPSKYISKPLKSNTTN